MKKIVIFGATGKTGLCSLEYAVKAGYHTRAFVRSANKIPDHLRDKVEAVIGDVVNSKKVSEAISGMDGVVVVLGTRDQIKPTTVLSEGLKNIIDAMKTNNIQVFSVCLSAFLFYTPEQVPTIFKDLNDEHQRMFDLVKKSGLKWIAILPPRITEFPSSQYSIKYDQSPGNAISKHDLGEFLVKSLEYPEYYQKVCGIAMTS